MLFMHIHFYTFFDSLFVWAVHKNTFFTRRRHQKPAAIIIHVYKVLPTFFCPDTINNKLNFQLDKHNKKVR